MARRRGARGRTVLIEVGDVADDRFARLESSVGELERSLARIERRVAAIEDALAAALASGVVNHAVAASDAPERERSTEPAARRTGHDPAAVMAYGGRSLVALGGAYFLRALTDLGVLPAPVGVLSGLVYAAAWLVLADRAGAAGRSLSATFHALVAAMIGFPVLWEGATRFNVIGPAASAAALAALTGVTLVVAIRQRLQIVAWIVVVPALTTSLLLIAASGSVLPVAVFLIALGVATLWLGYLPLYWRFLRWPVAVVADLSVFALAMRAASQGRPDPPLAVIAVQLLLLTAYLASIVIRTLIRGREVIPFEVVQSGAVLLVGFGGAVYVAGITGAGEQSLAVVNLLAGAGCYGVAFAFMATRQGFRRNFYFYTSLAIVLVLVSTRLMVTHTASASAFAMLGVLSACLAWRMGQIALTLHAAVYLLAAAGDAGLLGAAAVALLAPASTAWLPFTPVALAVLAAMAVAWVVPFSPRGESWGWFTPLPRVTIAALLAWSLGGAMVGWLTPMLAGRPGAGADPGVVATIRSAVAAAAALALAELGRVGRFREASQLVYPVLLAAGFKLVIEDFRLSQPATLFVALALYGSALIVSPRWLRRH